MPEDRDIWDLEDQHLMNEPEYPDIHPDGCFYCGSGHLSTDCQDAEKGEYLRWKHGTD